MRSASGNRSLVGCVLNAPQIDTNQTRSSQGWFVCHQPLMPRGSYLSCFAKKGNPKKATPIFALILRCSQRAGVARHRADAALTRRHCTMSATLGPRVAPLLGVEYTGTPSDGYWIALRWVLHEHLDTSIRTIQLGFREATSSGTSNNSRQLWGLLNSREME